MTSAVQSHIRSEHSERIQLRIRGTLQGIGFRPFVFHLAQDLSLGGWIANTTQGTIIELGKGHETTSEFFRIGSRPSFLFQELFNPYLQPLFRSSASSHFLSAPANWTIRRIQSFHPIWLPVKTA